MPGGGGIREGTWSHTTSMPPEIGDVGVSIVIYRTPLAAIAPLIDSLKTAGAERIYVVDNGPVDDETAAGRVEILRPGRNLGYGKGHNLAIRRSVRLHRYHLICNPDIVLPAGALQALIGFMDANPEVGLCMPRLVGPDGQMQFCCRRSPVVQDYLSQVLLPRSWGLRRRLSLEMRSHDYLSPMEVPCLAGCFMLFRSRVLADLDGFDERFFMYFEDFDLSLRAMTRARNVYYPSVQVIHERQSAHRRSLKLKFVFARSAFQYFGKWGWFRSRPPVAARA